MCRWRLVAGVYVCVRGTLLHLEGDDTNQLTTFMFHENRGSGYSGTSTYACEFSYSIATCRGAPSCHAGWPLF